MEARDETFPIWTKEGHCKHSCGTDQISISFNPYVFKFIVRERCFGFKRVTLLLCKFFIVCFVIVFLVYRCNEPGNMWIYLWRRLGRSVTYILGQVTAPSLPYMFHVFLPLEKSLLQRFISLKGEKSLHTSCSPQYINPWFCMYSPVLSPPQRYEYTLSTTIHNLVLYLFKIKIT